MKTSTARSLAAIAFLLGPLVALRAAEKPATLERPNLVLIFADDFGYGDPGCYGGTLVPTPAIDSLARDGVRCTDGYVTAPVCAEPLRADDRLLQPALRDAVER